MQREPQGLNVKSRMVLSKASILAFLPDAVAFPFSEYDTVRWKELDGSGGSRINIGVVVKIHFSLRNLNGTGGCATIDGIHFMHGNAKVSDFRVEVEASRYFNGNYVFAKDNISMLSSSRSVITEKIKKGDIYKK